MKPHYTIAVTGLNAVDSPGPGIPVIRGLKESQHFEARIIGLSYDSLEPGIYMHDLVDKTYQIPYPSTGYDTLLKRLEYIHEKEKIDVIIPNFDAEILSFIKLQPTLKAMNIHTLLPTIEQFEDRLKGNLVAFGKKHDIQIPKSEEVLHQGELFELLDKGEFEYPVVVKGKFYEAYIAYSFEQARAYFHKVVSKWGAPAILQEFIQGEEFNVIALGDGKGNLIGAVPMRKTFITEAGKAWAGVSIEDEDLMQMAKNVIQNTRWAGGMELELIKDKAGKVFLIEINPRFPAWAYLAVGAGQNLPEAAVRLAMGEKVEPFQEYEVGKMFIRYSFDMICDLQEYAQISMTGEL